ncbi:MAG: glucosaminidase domain-containing protein [Flavobacteriaceae bacterium]|nr:glucosaminidase domain-containing protein [Flavobacteriaceae bacterium]
MRFRVILLLVGVLFLASCSSSRRVTTKKTKKVTISESKPKKFPSVKQVQHVRKLERDDKSLNKHTLQYIRKYAPLAVLEMHQYKIPASITLAQGILESGNGRSGLASKSNNHFGIKCHKGWKGERVYHDDDEKGECFRKYKYVETSYKDHSKFLSGRRRYENLFKLRKTDYKGWAKGLKKAGYATDRKYPKKLIKIIQNYKLYEFDKFTKKDLKRGKRATKKEKRSKNPIVTKKKNSFKTYQVKKGDTLYSISVKFKVTVAKLKKLNGLKDNNLSIGQKLQIQ